MREAARSEYRFSSLIMGVVNSVPFQMRRTQVPVSPASGAARGVGAPASEAIRERGARGPRE
jgi:hypothetical protein